MQKSFLFFTGSLVFGCSLLAHLPAQLVAPEQLGELQFLNIGGTVWQGEVGQILYSGKALPVSTVNWTVKPAALLGGTLEAVFSEQQSPTNRGNVSLNLLSRQLDLHALHWQLPTGSLDSWFRSGVSLQGEFELDVKTLQLPPGKLFPSQLDALLDWKNAALQFDAEYWPIGSPLVRFSVLGNAVKGDLTNSRSLLPGEGSFQCTSKSCQVDLSLQPTADAPQSLLTALVFVGLQQTGDTYSGQITLPVQ